MPTTPISKDCVPGPSSASAGAVHVHSSPTAPPSNGGLSAGAIIGIAIGGSITGVLVVVGAVAVAAFLIGHKKKKENVAMGQVPISMEPTGLVLVGDMDGVPLGMPIAVDSGGMGMMMAPISEATEIVPPPAGSPYASIGSVVSTS